MQNLKTIGLKATTPRLKILELFQTQSASHQRHLSADDVYRALILENQDIGLATVYRVLAQFEQAGILSRNYFASSDAMGSGAGKAVYELADAQHHDHLVCLDCGRVEEFFDADIEAKQHAVSRAKGFELADHALSLYAHCTKPSCPSKPAGV
ncbi:MAG: ferric iron uptake transcriptional regulator [Cytophagales bacterium]|nr:ferric iron uptake transcriptional regulator [Cytophagales bacterium]